MTTSQGRFLTGVLTLREWELGQEEWRVMNKNAELLFQRGESCPLKNIEKKFHVNKRHKAEFL